MNTKSELANNLKKILDQMTQEEFDSEWSNVTSLNLESRLLGDPIKILTDDQLIDELKSRGYITKLLFNRIELKWVQLMVSVELIFFRQNRTMTLSTTYS